MRLQQLVEHRRTWRVLIGAPLLACLLVVSGCSARFFYNRLDTFASWYFESLVSLNDAQRSELRTWLESTLAWHRKSELTRYAEFIADISSTAAQPSSHDTYEALRLRFEGLMNNLVAKTAPEAAELLLRLSPQQVDELLANLEEKSRRSAKENAEAVAKNTWRPKQTKGFIKQFKRWTGAVTPQQKEMIAATIAQLEPTYEDWAESQRAWREALRQALLHRPSGEDDTVSPRLLSLLEDPDQQWTPAYSAKVARNRERYQQLLIDLDASLSAAQRAHLRKELDALATTLTRLAKD
jgi:hypothetical protein